MLTRYKPSTFHLYLLICLFILTVTNTKKFQSLPAQYSRTGLGSANELGGPGLALSTDKNEPIRYCYFDHRIPCNSNFNCPYDERPCKSNREYFDEVYTVEKDRLPKLSSGNNNNNNDNNNENNNGENNDQDGKHKLQMLRKYQSLTKVERRKRRQKLFLMSTWLEDLLPDPHQGRTWIVNAVVDMLKISFRATTILLSLVKVVPKPKFMVEY